MGCFDSLEWQPNWFPSIRAIFVIFGNQYSQMVGKNPASLITLGVHTKHIEPEGFAVNWSQSESNVRNTAEKNVYFNSFCSL